MDPKILPFNDGSAAQVLHPQEPETQALHAEANGLLETAKSFLVRTPDDYRRAGAFFAQIKSKIKDVEAERTKRVKPLNDTVRLINSDFKAITDQLEMVLRVVEAPMLAFKREEERQRQEAEAAAAAERKRIEDKARAKAAEEQAKLEAARKAEDEARRDAEQAASPVAAFIARAKAEAAAREAEEARNATMQAMRDGAMAQQAVPVIAAPKVTAAGTSFRKAWKFRIVNPNDIPREYMIPNEQLLGQVAREQKENASIPGVEFFAVDSIGGR